MENVRGLNIDVLTGAINPLPRTRDKGDDGLWVSFSNESHYSDVKTRDEGRPVFEMQTYIKIVVPGDATSIVFRPIRNEDKERFPQQYQAFLQGQSQIQGTPLKGWPHINAAQVDELSFYKIQTVEQLASVSDANAQGYRGLNELRTKAIAYLEQLKSEAPLMKVQAELASRDETIAALQNSLIEAQKAIARIEKRNKKRDVNEVVDEAEPA